MSTRCSVIFQGSQSGSSYVTTAEFPLEKPTRKQFYHHHDGYLSGVGEDLFNVIRNKGMIMEGKEPRVSFSYQHLERGYEPEESNLIHWDWEYLYLVVFSKKCIEFYFTQESPTYDECVKDHDKALEKMEICTQPENMTLFAKIPFGEYGINGVFLNTTLDD